MLTSRPNQDGTKVEESLSGGMYGLHDVCAGKSFRCMNRQLRNRFWIGAKDDWLITTDRVCELKLLNPISGEAISLPPFEIANHVHVDEHNQWPLCNCFILGQVDGFHIEKFKCLDSTNKSKRLLWMLQVLSIGIFGCPSSQLQGDWSRRRWVHIFMKHR